MFQQHREAMKHIVIEGSEQLQEEEEEEEEEVKKEIEEEQQKKSTKELQMLQSLKGLPPEQVKQIAQLLLQDPVLSDITLPHLAHLTDYDIDKMIAREKGELYPLYLRRLDNELIAFEMTPSTTVAQLKKDIKKVLSQKEEHRTGNRKISWKYVWRNNCLVWNGIKLLDDCKGLMGDIGIHPNTEITFARLKSA